MPTKQDDRQLNINFDLKPDIAQLLNKSTFFVQLELRSELDGTLSPLAIALAKAADNLFPGDELSFNLNSLLEDGTTTTTTKSLAQLQAMTQRPVVMTLSGQGRSLYNIKTEAAEAKSVGISNVLVATGNLSPLHTPDKRGHYAPLTPGYVDSLDILSSLDTLQPNFTRGAVVNPYKYTPEDQCLQYAKMVRKCHRGSEFLVAQAGWDMKKAQELQWFMQMRELVRPTLARLFLLTCEEARQLPNIDVPGLAFPLPVAAALQRHTDDEKNFEDYQFNLATLQAIGYKWLGYSGLQIRGIFQADKLREFHRRLAELQKDITSYATWLERWNQFHGDISFAPTPTLHSTSRNHYLFTNLLDPQVLNYDEQICELAKSSIEQPPTLQVLKARLMKPSAKSLPAKIVKNMFKPGTEACYALHNDSCPKRLTKSPCGNSKTDGFCEANHAPCFFKKVVEFSSALGEMNILEND